MAEVMLKTNRQSPTEVKKEDEPVYEEINMAIIPTEPTPDTNNKKSACIKSCPSIAASWGILLVIMALRIYFTTTLFLAEEDLRLNQTNLRLQIHNLTQVFTVLEKHIRNLTAEKKNLTQKNEELEAEKKNLTEQIHHTKTSWNELNVSRAQWSIDAYCPKQNNNRQCQPCQNGWLTFQSSCYAINNAETPEQKTWEEARENCRGKISDLVVVINAAEKTYLSEKSWGSSENKGYWIGLRAEGGKWKWVDGSNLTDNSWIQQPPSDGLCAISVQNRGFKSVSCGEKNRWICKKKALSV